MKSQIEFIKDIIKLKNENPEMEIHFCVSGDEVLEEFGWTAHQITRVQINPWFVDEEIILTDEDEIKDFLADGCDEELSDSEVAELVNEKYIKQTGIAICVYTHCG